MKHLSIIFVLAVAVAMNLAFTNCVCASLLQFYPLSAKQVYDALRKAGREDAVPQGRFITQGLAAITGWAAGIATGIGVPLVLNIDLANVTGILGNSNSNNNNNNNNNGGGTNNARVQEICFNSRNLEEIEVHEVQGTAKTHEGRKLRKNDDEDFINDPTTMDDGLENAPTGTTSSAEPSLYESRKEMPNTQVRSTNNENDDANINSNSPTATTRAIDSPEATNTNTNTNTGTSVDDGTGTGTNSITTTQTGTAGRAVNCVVIERARRR